MLGRFLFPFLGGQRDIHQSYSYAWLSDALAAEEFDLFLITRDGSSTSYLNSPFDIRPLATWLPNIEIHRGSRKCRLPFPPNEKVPDDHKAPEWRLMWQTPGDLPETQSPEIYSQWRATCKSLRISKPDVNLTTLFVGCSYCGFGAVVRLPDRAKLHTACGKFYVTVPCRAN
jgi:hypothetical protein